MGYWRYGLVAENKEIKIYELYFDKKYILISGCPVSKKEVRSKKIFQMIIKDIIYKPKIWTVKDFGKTKDIINEKFGVR